MSNAATDSSTTVVHKGDYLAQVNRGKPFTRSYNWLAACNEGREGDLHLSQFGNNRKREQMLVVDRRKENIKL